MAEGVREGPREVGGEHIAALGIGDDADSHCLGRGVPGDRLQAIESGERPVEGISEHLGRSQCDPEPGVRAGSHADGQEVDRCGRQAGVDEQLADHGQEVPAVSRRGIGTGHMDRPVPPRIPTALRVVDVSRARIVPAVSPVRSLLRSVIVSPAEPLWR